MGKVNIRAIMPGFQSRYFVTISLLITLVAMESSCKGQTGGSSRGVDRQPAVAGSFYPASREQLVRDLQGYFDAAEVSLTSQPIALIVPHAGYVFSGPVAAAGYKQLDRERKFKHIFLVGSSHTMYFSGVSAYTQGDFITPLGRVRVDNLAKELADRYDFITDDPKPHEREHGLEVQLPFLQYWLKHEFSIVPLIVGGESQSTSTMLAEALAPYLNEENLFVVSSDFSHYPSYNEARKSDESMANAIVSNSSSAFMTAKLKAENSGVDNLVTAMCGWTSGLTLLKMTEKIKGITYQPLTYRNSGDSPYGENDRVVGYWAIAVLRSSNQPGDFSLSDEDKRELLKLARKTITDQLAGHRSTPPDEQTLSASLKTNAGAFVTLRRDGQLRGCIGNFSTTTPLYRVVMAMAVAAATEDYRFPPVTNKELDEIDIEISVLTPMKKISSIDEIELGRHGIYIRKGGHSGTFLPQVASETGWSLEEFLGHCARDKALIGWDGWRDAEIFTYEAIVFEEKDFKMN
jgi:AmmeMemoRadiSam system protein B/AmmeMemoRadiSam system protein A